MSVLNPTWYVAQTDGKVTLSYPFNNDTYPEYKQDYNTGLLDKSIWLFTAPDGLYGYGNYASIHYCTDSSKLQSITESVQNTYSKNMFRFGKATYAGGTGLNGNVVLNTRWFPNAISPSCNAQFWLDYDYGNTCLYPVFSIFNIETGATVSNLSYNEMIDYNQTQWLCHRIYLYAYVGNKKETTGRTSQTGFSIINQYAGYIPGINGNGILSRDPIGGTWYWCKSNTLFEMGTPYARKNSSGVITLSSSSILTPYDTNALFRTVEITNGTNTDIYKGINFIDAGHCVTALGHYWAKTLNSAINSELGSHCTDDNIVGAIIDSNNKIKFDDPDNDTFTGQQIADIANSDPNSNFNWGAGAKNKDGKTIEEIQENTNPENSEETDETDLNDLTYSTAGAFNTAYSASETTINSIAQWLWNGSPNLDWGDLLAGLSLMGENPINAIVGIRLFPLSINTYANTGAYETVYVGKESTGIMARPIHKGTIIIDMGGMSYTVADKHAFLNYEPYSSCHIYIPYCGIITISPTEVINKNVSVKMIIDLVTGACTGVLFVDGIAFAYKDGVIGIEIPITGANMSQYFSNLLNGAMSGATSGMSVGSNLNDIVSTTASAPAVVGLGGAVGAVAGAIAGQAKGVTISKQGASSPACSLAQPQYCYMIIETPKEIDTMTNYGHTDGYLSYRTGTIQSFVGTGFSVFANIDTNTIPNATESERNKIKTMLESGVYL